MHLTFSHLAMGVALPDLETCAAPLRGVCGC